MTGDELLKRANELARQHGENIDPLHQIIIKLVFDLTNCQKENGELKARIEELESAQNVPKLMAEIEGYRLLVGDVVTRVSDGVLFRVHTIYRQDSGSVSTYALQQLGSNYRCYMDSQGRGLPVASDETFRLKT